jgi:hypothetical protein
MQHQAPIKPTPATHYASKAQLQPKNPPVGFAHKGFAVAGTANNNKVYVWDSEWGDQLLSLDHGGKYPT